MKLLLDTHALVWWVEDLDRLGRLARALIGNRKNEVWVSAVSLWELAIKTALGRMVLKDPLEEPQWISPRAN
jgi:PIN domain nuclease of toxin-antitoxin system